MMCLEKYCLRSKKSYVSGFVFGCGDKRSASVSTSIKITESTITFIETSSIPELESSGSILRDKR